MVTLTAAGTAAIAAGRPIVKKAELIKNYYASQTVIDITERVAAWGTLSTRSSLFELDAMEPQQLILTVGDADGYFSRGFSGSVWAASPAKEPEECIIRVRRWLQVDEQTLELLTDFKGRVRSTSLSESGSYVEIPLVAEPWDKLENTCKPEDGSYTEVDWKATPPSTYVNNDKGGSIFQSPNLIDEPVQRGGAGFQYTHWYFRLRYVVQCIRAKFKSIGVSYPVDLEVLPHTWYQEKPLIDDAAATVGTHELRMELIAGTPNIYTEADIVFYNPPAWKDHSPATVLDDLLGIVAGIDSAFIDGTSLSNADTFLLALPVAQTLRAVIYGSSFAEHALELLAYMPEHHLVVTHDTKLKLLLIEDLSSASPDATILEDEIGALESHGPDFSRLATEIRARYNAFVDNGNSAADTIWQLERDPQIGQRRASQYSDARFFYRNELVAGTPVKKQLLEVELPWISGEVSDHWDRIGQWIERVFDLFGAGLLRTSLSVARKHNVLEVGDVVALSFERIRVSAKKYHVVGIEQNLDTEEVGLTLLDVSRDSALD